MDKGDGAGYPLAVNRLALLLLLLALVARAEDQTSELTEAKAAFAKADRALNEAWTAMKKALPNKIFAELKGQQRGWLESRDRRALESLPTPNDAAEAKRSAAYWQTAASLTDVRAQWLRRLADNEDDPHTGLWTDGNGGNLEIVERKEKLFFVFHAVRGRALHLGVLAGAAHWNSPIGWFSDKGREADKPDETNIAFIEKERHLEVTGANTSHYHGAHAYFDGNYYKIAPLDRKDEENVVKAGESGNVPEE
ncbi:MAG TPA: lysozyme inhibitor LprI family protein [Chthoniobacterales bacterium]|nr:lysozyme inhibitor LprI family protein [Chthoniobacterales bacterium]